MTKLLVELLWLTARVDWLPMLACFCLGVAVGLVAGVCWVTRKRKPAAGPPEWKTHEVI